MSYSKTIVCLAKSIKHGGYCVAGKELTGDRFAGWIRTVSDREDEEIAPSECKYADGREASLLDTINIPMLEPRPRAYQAENHLINTGQRWHKQGQIDWNALEPLIDTIDGPLWSNGTSSTYGINDRVPENVASQFTYSLALIRPEQLDICVETEGAEFGNPRRKTRAAFQVNGERYKLAVTDPLIRTAYRSQPGLHRLQENVLLCVSLGEVYEGCAYKLVAAVIRRDIHR